MSWLHGVRAQLSHMFARRANEERMHEEMELHLELETQRLMRDAHLSEPEARRQALVAFGGVERHKEYVRDGLGLRWLASLQLDLKLGFRMLVKYPVLTLVGCLALSVAIGAGAAYLEFLNDLFRSKLPMEGGDRIVMIQNWNASTRQRDPHILHDYVLWRNELKSIGEFATFRSVERNLSVPNGIVTTAQGAEMSVAAFRLTRARVMLGRTLLEGDERADAPAVVVLGYRLWQKQFQGDSDIVGRSIQVGSVRSTVVGVMNEGFAFPVNEQFWLPFRMNPSEFARGTEPKVNVVGRLADGATLHGAQAELSTIGARVARDHPAISQHVRPIVKPYLEWATLADDEDVLVMRILYWLNLFFIGLLCVCGANVATLVFARTITREEEIGIRTALGASRGRIMSQLGMEAFVLATLAAGIGVAGAYYGSRWMFTEIVAVTPFWWDYGFSPGTIMYAVFLAALSAVLIGVVPARRATEGDLHVRLKNGTSGAGTGVRSGRLWNAVIVMQVSLTVLFLFVVAAVGWNVHVGQFIPAPLTIPSSEFLSARVGSDRERLPDGSMKSMSDTERIQYDASIGELQNKLLRNPEVASVTYTSRFPGTEMQFMRIEVEGEPELRLVRTTEVGPGFHAAIGNDILAGRAFSAGDLAQGRNSVIVDQSFQKLVLGGRNAVGRRVREVLWGEQAKPGAWMEIVGVVADLTIVPIRRAEDAMLYRPVTPSDAYPAFIAVRTRVNARSFSYALFSMAAEVNSNLTLREVMPLNEAGRVSEELYAYGMRVLFVIGFIAIVLSAAGIYSLMAFTVARRTREIGIRIALGGTAGRIVRTIFSPTVKRIGLGLAIGGVPGFALITFGAPEVARGGGYLVGLLAFLAVASFTMIVGLVACFVPARRALRIHPTEALSAGD